jgi:hypothetical protein
MINLRILAFNLTNQLGLGWTLTTNSPIFDAFLSAAKKTFGCKVFICNE